MLWQTLLYNSDNNNIAISYLNAAYKAFHFPHKKAGMHCIFDNTLQVDLFFPMKIKLSA